MKALIIEDEKAAVRNLQAVLARVAPEVEVIEVLDSVADTLDWFATHPLPELAFVDIHLADGSAFELFSIPHNRSSFSNVIIITYLLCFMALS